MASRAVVCQDLLIQIFLHLSPDWKPQQYDAYELYQRRQRRSTLAACAIANRMMSECALPFLWRVLDSIAPLMQVLAHNSNHEGSDVIDESAWCRLQRYASLVRELKHRDEDKRYPRSHPIWLALAGKLNGEPLFPSLQRLEVAIYVSEPAAYLLVFSPSIRTLAFGMMPQEWHERINGLASTRALLASLCSTTPFTGVPAVPPHVTRHLERIGRLGELRKLDLLTSYGLLPMDYRLMVALSTLDNLRELSIDVLFKDMDSHVPCRGGFPALESFAVIGASLHDIEEALRMVPSSRLRNLKVTVSMGVDAQRLTAFFDNLRRAAVVGITSLWLQLNGPIDMITFTPVVDLAEVLEPVLSLRHLQELTCRFDTYFVAVSDRDIAAFATAFPDLRVLKLHDSGYDSLDAGITVSALLDVARRCPRLESIFFRNLHVRASNLPDPGSVPRMAQSRVRHVEFDKVRVSGYMSPADVWILACLIDRIFPHLVITSDTQGASRLPPEVLEPLTTLRASRHGGSEID